jgi:putative ABC transport system substrate-binding protein
MRRRELITLLSGAAVAWPLATFAQQPERVRRISVLTGVAGNDSEIKDRLAAFSRQLQQLGWTEGRNMRIDIRGGGGDLAATRKYAAELAALAPDVILAIGNATMAPLIEATRTVPIVFTVVIDPVGADFVETLSRPGGNMTGFMMFEYSLSGKWLELLREIAPQVTRAAVLREPASTAGIGQFAVIQAIAPSLGIEVSAMNARDAGQIERAITEFARTGNGGLIVTASPGAVVYRRQIIDLALRYKLPAVYTGSTFVADGGLISYGPNLVEQTGQAAFYVDRIFKGEKPANLPVQAPTKYELVINLKTAKSLGLTVPPSLLARADQMID